MPTINEQALSLYDRFSKPGQRCPECGEVAVAGERTRRLVYLEGNKCSLDRKVHAVYSVCAPCGDKPSLRIIAEFDRLMEHMVSSECYAILVSEKSQVVN
jgi:hypothetical protein